MEALSCLRKDREGGYLSDFKVNSKVDESFKVSHFLFVDATLVFCEATHTQLSYLSWLLMWFEVISSLKINLSKSKFFLVGKVENLNELAFVLGCKVGFLPTTYLALPLGVPSNFWAVWDGVKDKFQKRLTKWKRQYISKGGTLTLIRSI